MSSGVIKIRGLSKSFNENIIFTNINLSIDKGQSLTIIGGSGQGKSVLLKCIVGLIDPDDGVIIFNDSLISKKNKSEFLNDVGILFQGAALFDSLPVWENITFKFKYTGNMSSKDRQHLAKQKLDLVGLPKNTADLFPSELSGGMKKRVGIARAIVGDPKILFLDEPTSGLDPIMSNTINNLIRTIVKEFGKTTVTISHDLRLISDTVALLHNGKIDYKGTISDFETTKNSNIKKFINPNLIE